MRWTVALVLLAACHPAPSGDADRRFTAFAERFFDSWMSIKPAMGVLSGQHQYDGRLPDNSAAGLQAQRAWLVATANELATFDPGELTPTHRLEHASIATQVATYRFDLEVRRRPWRDPSYALWDSEIGPYTFRDYAPAEQRARAVGRLCDALPAYLQHARDNLEDAPLARPWVELALMQAKGQAEFADKDARVLLPPAAAALDRCKAALDQHVAWLTELLPRATGSYALGEAAFLAMLESTQGITLDLATLEHAAQADLERNTRALEEAAHAIAPDKPVAEVLAMLAGEDKPTAEGVLPLARQQVEVARQFMVEHHLGTIPGEIHLEVRATPPYQRWNLASLDVGGTFEPHPLPSFYYISPPDPSWPAEEQAAYLPAPADLMFVTVHEVWPGHYLQQLHIDRLSSKILRTVWNYAAGEGWAHYTEEMMWDQGLGDHDPRWRIGMLKNALLRDVRFLAGIGLHCHGMTVDQAAQLFRDKAFQDPGNARQQAVRGTFDPMYVSYTLGKLIIRKLARDWLAAAPGRTLGQFHDAFLEHGGAPLPAVRADMLGSAAGLL